MKTDLYETKEQLLGVRYDKPGHIMLMYIYTNFKNGMALSKPFVGYECVALNEAATALN